MKLILITQPNFFDGEAEVLNGLLRQGLPLLHLRKPQATAAQKDALIAQIAPEFRNRIVMHNHEIHSCHTLEEVRRNKMRSDYVFLSPIFDSISKQGYKAAFTEDDLRRAHRDGIVDNKVVALGGITPANACKALTLGFGGVAVLGDIWQNADSAKRLTEYLKILN